MTCFRGLRCRVCTVSTGLRLECATRWNSCAESGSYTFWTKSEFDPGVPASTKRAERVAERPCGGGARRTAPRSRAPLPSRRLRARTRGLRDSDAEKAVRSGEALTEPRPLARILILGGGQGGLPRRKARASHIPHRLSSSLMQARRCSLLVGLIGMSSVYRQAEGSQATLLSSGRRWSGG